MYCPDCKKISENQPIAYPTCPFCPSVLYRPVEPVDRRLDDTFGLTHCPSCKSCKSRDNIPFHKFCHPFKGEVEIICDVCLCEAEFEPYDEEPTIPVPYAPTSFSTTPPSPHYCSPNSVTAPTSRRQQGLNRISFQLRSNLPIIPGVFTRAHTRLKTYDEDRNLNAVARAVEETSGHWRARLGHNLNTLILENLKALLPTHLSRCGVCAVVIHIGVSYFRNDTGALLGVCDSCVKIWRRHKKK